MSVLSSQPPYPNKFKAGDIAIATKHISFCDGTKHVPGQRIEVDEQSKHYYNVWHHIYKREPNA